MSEIEAEGDSSNSSIIHDEDENALLPDQCCRCNYYGGGCSIYRKSGKGKYAGKISTTYRIFNINISSAKVSITAQNYSGTNIILSDNVNVTYNTISLTFGEEYIVSGYMNNSSAGTVTVNLKGVGEYCGTKTVKFSIKKKAIIPNFIGAF